MSTVPLLCGTSRLTQHKTELTNRPDVVLHGKKTCLLIDIAIPDESNFNIEETKKKGKTKRIRRPGYLGQKGVESEDKNCAAYDFSIRND